MVYGRECIMSCSMEFLSGSPHVIFYVKCMFPVQWVAMIIAIQAAAKYLY